MPLDTGPYAGYVKRVGEEGKRAVRLQREAKSALFIPYAPARKVTGSYDAKDLSKKGKGGCLRGLLVFVASTTASEL